MCTCVRWWGGRCLGWVAEQWWGKQHAAACGLLLSPAARRRALHAAAARTAHPRNSIVLMLKPSVGLIVEMSSPLSRLTMVVLPALSRPL